MFYIMHFFDCISRENVAPAVSNSDYDTISNNKAAFTHNNPQTALGPMYNAFQNTCALTEKLSLVSHE